MFDVIVDSKILGVRERAKAGNFDSMIALAGFIQRGKHTPRNEELALKIIDHVLAHRKEVPLPETIWNAICWKVHLVDDAGRDELYTDLIQDMASHDPGLWDHEQMIWALQWLHNRKEQRESSEG